MSILRFSTAEYNELFNDYHMFITYIYPSLIFQHLFFLAIHKYGWISMFACRTGNKKDVLLNYLNVIPTNEIYYNWQITWCCCRVLPKVTLLISFIQDVFYNETLSLLSLKFGVYFPSFALNLSLHSYVYWPIKCSISATVWFPKL
jgi:hypothetical protein